MSVQPKYVYIAVGVVALLGAFALGRYTTPDRVEIRKEIVTVEVEKKVIDEVKNVNVKQRTVVEETTKPDGTIVKKTVVDTDETSITDTETVVETKKDSTQLDTKIVDKGRKLNLALIAGPDFTNLGSPLVYGATVSRQFIGPLTLGLWGISSGHGGLSIGLQF